MTYLELQEKLGITANNKDAQNRFILNILNNISEYKNEDIPLSKVFDICNSIGMQADLVGRKKRFIDYCNMEMVLLDILSTDAGSYYDNRRDPVEFNEFILRLSMILKNEHFVKHNDFCNSVKEALSTWKLPYELCDGIIIPKGVKEFDEALVCDVAEWLHDYPSAHKLYTNALQEHCNNNEPSQIADSLRKSFESFLIEFFGNTKNLENNINELGTYLKNHGVNEDIRGMFISLVKSYKKNNDKTAKHHDKTDRNSVEFLLYQTGVFMRYMLIIKKDSVTN